MQYYTSPWINSIFISVSILSLDSMSRLVLFGHSNPGHRHFLGGPGHNCFSRGTWAEVLSSMIWTQVLGDVGRNTYSGVLAKGAYLGTKAEALIGGPGPRWAQILTLGIWPRDTDLGNLSTLTLETYLGDLGRGGDLGDLGRGRDLGNLGRGSDLGSLGRGSDLGNLGRGSDRGLGKT